jgi:hypothetical protein
MLPQAVEAGEEVSAEVGEEAVSDGAVDSAVAEVVVGEGGKTPSLYFFFLKIA